MFQFLQLPKSLFCLCDLTISMDADCLLPWKSVLPWSRPEISHAPTLSMYGREGLVVGERSSTLWFKMPYIIWVNLNHISLYLTNIQKNIDNVWPFWEDFAISFHQQLHQRIPGIAKPLGSLRLCFRIRACFFGKWGWAILRKRRIMRLLAKSLENLGKTSIFCSIWSTQIPVYQLFQAPAGHPQKIHGFETKFTRSFHQGIYLSWTNIKLPKTKKSPLKMDA